MAWIERINLASRQVAQVVTGNAEGIGNCFGEEEAMSEGVLGSAIVGIVRRVRLRRTTAVLICALLMGLPALLIGAPDAAADDIEGCSLFGNRPSIDVDSSVIERFRGSWMALHDGVGDPTVHTDTEGTPPLGSSNAVPVCVAFVSPDGSVGQPFWAFCMDMEKRPCSEQALGEASLDLPAEEVALVAWIINEWQSVPVVTTNNLEVAQHRVWCVTNDYDSALDDVYFGSGASDCDGFRTWLESNVLPDLVLPSSSLEVNGPDSPLSLGGTAVFEVSSSVRTLNVSGVGVGELEVCADNANGVLAGSRLTLLDQTEPVRLCVDSDVAGSYVLTVRTPPALLPAHLIAHPDPICQVLYIHTVDGSMLEDIATADFLAESTTSSTSSTTSSSVPPELTTTVPQPSSTVSTTTGPEESSTTLPGTSGPSTSQSTRSETAALGARDRRGGQRPERMAHTGSSFVVLIAAGAGLIALGGALLAIQVRRRVA